MFRINRDFRKVLRFPRNMAEKVKIFQMSSYEKWKKLSARSSPPQTLKLLETFPHAPSCS